ncbi:alpha/beta fold hydrolase [Amycolatopsis suaedae]|uniref:Alpha/beta fold hydrolase n=1 Tax=Amycolatopsis suaedae TaxID=2510978 RepID=A0A4Q7J606_9PSEU|nr:alpha/beta fold hydrolase [Amycolatopsis suaedae]RZQ63021.1 alpha/beta fold hydrolase [Amycolatopsis suaedae]
MVDALARRLVRPGAVLRGEERGAGPTLLLLHAGGERRRVWTPVTDVLVPAGFRCVAFDQRGHGDSDGSPRRFGPCAGDVAAMVRAEPAGCVVVGASLGGLAAIGALADPEVRSRVAGLVLVDVVPGVDPTRVRDFLARQGLSGVYSELVEDILAQVSRLRRITAELGLPILLVRGGAGSPVTDEDVEDLRCLAPHVTVSRVPGAGHLVARDQPVALAETICRTFSPAASAG